MYLKIRYNEISGIFFYESWWLDHKTYRIFKDVAAYLPIREYVTTVYDGYENMETRRRLVFMVIPQWSSGTRKAIKYRPKDFRLIRKDMEYEIQLYNKPYDLYLYRESDYGQISQDEFNEWQYHYFDFYRHFDTGLFLEKIISGILNGKLHACMPGMPESPLSRKDFIKLLSNDPDLDNIADREESQRGDNGLSGLEPEMLPEDYPISDLNSVMFRENWYIHPGNLQIYKEVKAITINRTETLVDQYTGEFIQGSVVPLFTVWF